MIFQKKAILFIHGFSASYYENEYFLNSLQKHHELDVYTFTLPGHERPLMRKVKYEEWIERSEKEFLNLTKHYHQIYLVGHSMGGVIASYLASKYPDFAKRLILIAPAFEYGSFEQNKKDLKRFFSPKEKTERLGYDTFLSKLIQIPTKDFLEFTKLVKNYKSTIQKVTIPTLIIHGDEDNIVPFTASTYAYKNVKAKEKYITTLKGIRHQVFISDKKREVSEYIYLFTKFHFSFRKKYIKEI
ncbi:MAG: alpha/beta fold hydrolase [Firmicutes bacterium]|nr:alpha/beta fold hydrolase [Bacillota bacterium]